jgi:hypothetical protein
MTEEACMAVDRLYEGNPVECSIDAYHSEIRNALIALSLGGDLRVSVTEEAGCLVWRRAGVEQLRRDGFTK